MREALLVSVTIGGLIAIVYSLLLRQRIHRVSLERLYQTHSDSLDESLAPEIGRRFGQRRWVWPWAVALCLVAALRFIAGTSWLFAIAPGVMVGLLGQQLEAWLQSQQLDRIENQLADAIDLMIAAVKAGASLQSALELGVRDAKAPLQIYLSEVVGRIRLGDEVADALGVLVQRVPLESFRLFATTLVVNWSTGGSLAATLSTVGRTIRDRIEMTRRMRAMTTQSRASVVSILLVTYFIAALMWRNSPDRMAAFVGSTVGQWMIAGAMILQGVGMTWIAALSRPKF